MEEEADPMDARERRDLLRSLDAVQALCREPQLGKERIVAEANAATVTLHGVVSVDGLSRAVAALRRLRWVRRIQVQVTVEGDAGNLLEATSDSATHDAAPVSRRLAEVPDAAGRRGRPPGRYRSLRRGPE